MFQDRLPILGEQVLYWMDENTPAIAIVAKVIPDSIKDSGIALRPFLNLFVIRPDDAKGWSRIEIPSVHDQGSELSKTHRYSLIGEYDEIHPG